MRLLQHTDLRSYFVISSLRSQAKVLTEDLRKPLPNHSRRKKKDSKKGKPLWRNYDEVY